jgi:hypothetical protein
MATPDAVRELLDKMAAEREALLAQAEAFSEPDAEAAPADAVGEAQWSVKEQLAHLAEMETAYRAWVERAIEEDGADVSGVRGERPAIALTEAHAHTIAELTRQLRDQRQKTIRLIESMAPEQFERTASQPMFGRLTAMQWLRSYYRHDRMHRDQMAGREPEYRPRFAGGQEPDQRRRPRAGG